jgi:hypothetical protein
MFGLESSRRIRGWRLDLAMAVFDECSMMMAVRAAAETTYKRWVRRIATLHMYFRTRRKWVAVWGDAATISLTFSV